ncbi:hypothetical protein T492DRAFT_1073680 [Pavlovales sp. CCMP2436]|nr:hypothetical protein T492DRAFT_1073680 [Pavlovales sp. CCMP2436]|mmetsp:Transcript_19536/g.45953  ORF Transcript_19536/g.45953 Transcript_19536/m.45953 type:complete len:320 (-) Transcript_19536:114-1073(-)
MLVLAHLLATLSSSSADCTASPSSGGAVALEILAYVNCTVYTVNSPPYDGAEFEGWAIRPPWQPNMKGERHTTMTSSCLYASPGEASTQTIQLRQPEPWSPKAEWLYLSMFCPGELGLGGCFNEACNIEMLPVNGSLLYQEIAKCHKMEWATGTTVAKLYDPFGNVFIMHATNEQACTDAAEPCGNPQFPPGWYLKREVLAKTLVLTPVLDDSSAPIGRGMAFGTFACGYALITDAGSNGYHRIIDATGSSKYDIVPIVPSPSSGDGLVAEGAATAASGARLQVLAAAAAAAVVVVVVGRHLGSRSGSRFSDGVTMELA